MKILQISPRIPYPLNDGGAVYIYNATKYLSLLGHDVFLASFISNKHEQDPDKVAEYATLSVEDGKFTPYNGLSALKSLISRKPIQIQHRMDRDIMRRILQKVEVIPDVILLEGIHTAEFIPEVKNSFPGVPIVLRQSNVEYLIFKRNAAISNNPFLKLFLYDQAQLMKKFELSAMTYADAVTAITPYDREIYLNHLPNLRCHVSPAGADMPESLGLKRKKLTLLAISNWRWRPNLDGLQWFLNKVWPTLTDRFPEIKLDIIGDGLPDKLILDNASSNIEYHGFIEDLEPFRQSSTLFIAPLLSGSGMKLKVIEGLASGLPLVTTKFGSEGINIRDGVHYLEANTKEDFISRITDVLEDPELQNTLSKNARDVVKSEYDWKNITRDLVDFLEDVSKQRA